MFVFRHVSKFIPSPAPRAKLCAFLFGIIVWAVFLVALARVCILGWNQNVREATIATWNQLPKIAKIILKIRIKKNLNESLIELWKVEYVNKRFHKTKSSKKRKTMTHDNFTNVFWKFVCLHLLTSSWDNQSYQSKLFVVLLYFGFFAKQLTWYEYFSK